MIQKPSENQLEIFNTYRKTNKNIVVEAVPGSGKTTTILNLLTFVPIAKRVIYLAFNKSIVEEIKTKLPRHQNNISVSTLHGVGMGTIYKNSISKIKVEPLKAFKKFHELNALKWNIEDKKINYRAFCVSELYNLYRLNLVENIDDLRKVATKYDADFIEDDLQRTIDLAHFLEEYNRIDAPKFEKMIDFVDMLYFPIKYNMKVIQYDEIFIDECQDLNLLQQKLAWKVLRSPGRFVAVGDKNQCIYSFLGADPLSFEKFTEKPNTVKLPLSVSYRCSKEIAKFANKVFDTIQYVEKEFEGEVREGSVEEVGKGDFVLCRNNAPLIELYLHFVGQKKKCYIKGRDLGYSLMKLIEEVDSEYQLSSYFESVLIKLENDLRSKGISTPKNTGRYKHLLEKIEIINILLKKFPSLSELKQALKVMFSDEDDRNSIILSTIHKSKGLEASNVFILCHELIPSPYATLPWQLEQEENLRYVAYTRAKNKLLFINDFPAMENKTEEKCQQEQAA